MLTGVILHRAGKIIRGETPLSRAFARCFPAGN